MSNDSRSQHDFSLPKRSQEQTPRRTASTSSSDSKSYYYADLLARSKASSTTETTTQSTPQVEDIENRWSCLNPRCHWQGPRLPFTQRPRCPRCGDRSIIPPKNYVKWEIFECVKKPTCRYQEKIPNTPKEYRWVGA